jgi:hypothetical protein
MTIGAHLRSVVLTIDLPAAEDPLAAATAARMRLGGFCPDRRPTSQTGYLD